jgi:DNA-binding protein Alba
VEDFEESLAQFNVKAPFLVAQMIQKEGDHFSDEMEEAQPHIENMEVIVHHYPKHAGEELHLPSPPPRLEEIREKIVEIKPADIHEEGVVFIGRKPLVNYFSACSHLFFKLGRKEVKIKARGRFIAKAAHLASIFKSTAINIDHIEIGTSTLIDSTGEIRHVSFIEISLSAPITTC